MIDPLGAAEYFIVRAFEDGNDEGMTNLKLQKLLYYTQCLHLALFDSPLFEEQIQAWRHGPVCPSAYQFYSDYEAKQLPIPLGETFSEMPDSSLEVMEEAWDNFKDFSAERLSKMTHTEAPWLNARGDLPKHAASQEPLDLGDMKRLGVEILAAIERRHPDYEPAVEEALGEALVLVGKKTSNDNQDIRDWLESLLD